MHNIGSGDRGGALGWGHYRDEHALQGCLTCTVWSKQSEYFMADFEVQMIDGGEVAESLRDAESLHG
jgi:hypothetical protein